MAWNCGATNCLKFGSSNPNLCTRNTRAVWIGIFEKARSKGYTLTTYASVSKIASSDDNEWECSADVYKGSYTPLANLTKFHLNSKNCSDETTSILYVLFPIVFLTSAMLYAFHLPKLEKSRGIWCGLGQRRPTKEASIKYYYQNQSFNMLSTTRFAESRAPSISPGLC